MEINIYECLEGAKKAEGLAVIIDVFRAFTTACFVFYNGAEKIIPMGDLENCYQLKKQNKHFILMGERNEVIQEGFDYGNSPANIEHVRFDGKTVIHTTSAGTQGIVNAAVADEIITGSLVNAYACANYIKSRPFKKISLVCMGNSGLRRANEDLFCAEYIKSILLHTDYDINEKIAYLRENDGKRFFNPGNQINCPQRDFFLSTQVNRFDFVLKAEFDMVNQYYYLKI